MTETELAWLAGWLEGEGTFLARAPRPPRYPGWRVVIQAASTDIDVVRRAHSLTGCGTVRLATRQEPHHKDLWLWSVNRRADVLELASTLLPHMGSRRRASIEAILATPEPAPPRHRRAPCGTAAKYERGCRCERCRAANTARCRAYRERRRASLT